MWISLQLCSDLLHGLEGNNVLYHGLFHGLQALVPGAPCLPHLSLTLMCMHPCPSFFLFFLLLTPVQHFVLLNMLSQRHHQLGWGAQLYPASLKQLMGLLELSESSSCSSRDTLLCKPNTSMEKFLISSFFHVYLEACNRSITILLCGKQQDKRCGLEDQLKIALRI